MATRTFTASFSTNDVEAIQVVSMHLHQRMGKPSDAKVEVLFADAIDPDELVGGTCLISFAHEGEEPVALMGVAMSVSMVGSPETVRADLDDFIERTRADELIVISHVYDHGARLRSYELLATL